MHPSQTVYCALRPWATVRGMHDIYLVIRRIGSGGQVYVWLGKSLSSDINVVIREPRPDLDPSKYMLQLNRLREAYYILWKIYEAIQRSSYPSIYSYFEQIVDYQDTGICYYMVTRHVSGRTMDESTTCYRYASSSELCRRNVMALIRAAGFMHSIGVIHRDIKPRNIIEAPWGPVLIDFTTAKYFYRITLNDVYVRSPGGYTSPEQEQNKVVSTQSDVWSLGATLLKTATGQQPIRLMKRLGAPPSPSVLVKEFNLDSGLANLIAAAMDPDPARRPATAKEMELLLLGDPVEINEPEVIVLGRKFSLMGNKLIVGRSPEADVRIGMEIDPLHYVSSRHALLEFRPGEGWVLRDLCSTNGTAYWKPGMSGWRVIFPGRRREPGCTPGSPAGVEARLGDTALIALGYNESLGPYMVLVFRGSKLRMPGRV